MAVPSSRRPYCGPKIELQTLLCAYTGTRSVAAPFQVFSLSPHFAGLGTFDSYKSISGIDSRMKNLVMFDRVSLDFFTLLFYYQVRHKQWFELRCDVHTYLDVEEKSRMSEFRV